MSPRSPKNQVCHREAPSLSPRSPQRTLSGLGEFFGGLKVTDEKAALVFEKTSIARVQETYRGFLTNCPDATSLARKYPHRIREKYEIYLSDDLTAELFARERIDLDGAIGKIRESLP